MLVAVVVCMATLRVHRPFPRLRGIVLLLRFDRISPRITRCKEQGGAHADGRERHRVHRGHLDCVAGEEGRKKKCMALRSRHVDIHRATAGDSNRSSRHFSLPKTNISTFFSTRILHRRPIAYIPPACFDVCSIAYCLEQGSGPGPLPCSP